MCEGDVAGDDTLRLAAGLAVCIFNTGAKALAQILQTAGCPVVEYTVEALKLEDNTRIASSIRKASGEEEES